MTTTPQLCGEVAERLIGEYVREVGAYGDADLVRKALTMLISKAALGIEIVGGEEAAQHVLMSTALNVAAVVERRKEKAN